MASAGHATAHSPQATHFSSPFSSRISTCLPRHFGKHGDLLVGVIDRDLRLEEVPQRRGEPDDERTNHGGIISGTGNLKDCPDCTAPIPSHPASRCLAVHPDGEARRRGRARHDAGAVSVVPADSADRKAGLARAAGLRGEPRPAADRRRHLAAGAQQQRRRPDALRRLPGRPARRALRRGHRRRHAGHPADCSPANAAPCPSRSAAASPEAACASSARTKPSGISRRSSSPVSTATSGGWSGASRSTGS